MKKTLLFSLILVFLFSISSFAVQSSYVYTEASTVQITKQNNHGLFKKIKKDIKSKINYTKASIKKIKTINDTFHGINLQTSIILMVIGLIFLIVAGAVSSSIVGAVGAVFFLIGAIFLLLALI